MTENRETDLGDFVMLVMVVLVMVLGHGWIGHYADDDDGSENNEGLLKHISPQ
jgi:hypothetical protein